MIHIGDYNKLTILRDTEPGLFLGDNQDQEVLLPNRYVPDTFEIDDQMLKMIPPSLSDSIWPSPPQIQGGGGIIM